MKSATLLLVLLLCLRPPSDASAASAGPNVLFILADDLGWSDTTLHGWKPRSGEAVVKAGVLTMTGLGAAPFLGLAAGKLAGPTEVRFRARSTGGGNGKVEWRPTPQADAQARAVAFHLAGGGWQEVSVNLPAESALGIVRLYLPAQKEPVQLDWIELKPADGKARRSDF